MLRTHFSRQNVPRPRVAIPKSAEPMTISITVLRLAIAPRGASPNPLDHRYITDRPKLAGHASTIDAPHSKRLCSIRPSIGTENSIPEEMDHREIGVRVPVMNEVKFLFASEPRKP